jgi:hypothetical protein
MGEDTVVCFQKPELPRDALTELLRHGARQLLKQAVESELTEFLGEHAEKRDERGRAAVVRNGHLPEREVLTGIGPVAVRNGVRLDKISSTIHPYPTYVLGNRRAADLYMMRKLTPTMVHWLQRIFRLRGDTRGVTALQQM